MIVRPELEAYAEAVTTPHDELLARLADETRRTLPSPEMLCGPVVGRFLQTLVFASGASRVLEIGTYSGYSAISMAGGLPPDGRIDTLEVEPRHAELARRYIAEAGLAERISVHLGPALDTLATLDGPFDVVFVDADKPSYGRYLEAVLPKLAERGVVVFDNMLQHGRVVDDPDGNERTRAVVELNERLARDERVTAVVLTVRDGLTLVRRR